MREIHVCVTPPVSPVVLPQARPAGYCRRAAINRKEATRSMARARRAVTGKTSEETSGGSADGTFTCPECGKTFTRAASLGAHRNRAHGVAGASTRARRTRARRGHRNGGSTTRRGAGTQTTRQQSARGPGSSSDGSRSGINRDALLQSIFPNGVPAREEVIRRANAWLDEAERLARSK
jgi:uncharacterized C2H2 Zn-finger protein